MIIILQVIVEEMRLKWQQYCMNNRNSDGCHSIHVNIKIFKISIS